MTLASENAVQLSRKDTKSTGYFVSYASVVLTEVYSVMVNSEELTGTTECLAL